MTRPPVASAAPRLTAPHRPVQDLLPVVASSALLQGQTAVVIEHLGQHYRLQTTRQGKLILTK